MMLIYQNLDLGTACIVDEKKFGIIRTSKECNDLRWLYTVEIIARGEDFSLHLPRRFQSAYLLRAHHGGHET
jgi:hypothetical protein